MKKLIDAAERKAALDTNCSHHVESPAGSGKTFLLTMRFLKLLGEVEHPREILALTFTEKAAREMQERISNCLKSVKKDRLPSSPEEEELFRYSEAALSRHHEIAHLLTASDGLNIMTFHGFCSYLLKRAPLEGEVSPDYEILDETRQPFLIEEAVKQALRSCLNSPEDSNSRIAMENRLLLNNNNWNSLQTELKEIIINRDRFHDLIETVHSAGRGNLSSLSEAFEDRLRPYVEDRLKRLHRFVLASTLGERWTEFIDILKDNHAEAASILPANLPDFHWSFLPQWQNIASALLTKKGEPRKRLGPASGFFSGINRTEWGTMISDMDDRTSSALYETIIIPTIDDTKSQSHLLSDFIIMAAKAIESYGRILKREHIIDFNLLEEGALRALNECRPSDIYLSLDYHIHHILVDEFQDTSRKQWELLMRLTGGWEPDGNRTIFIVGDPKQSIYAFRNAEVGLFFKAKKGIPLSGRGKLPLLPLTLKTNFRSTTRIISWVNDLFGRYVMVNPDTSVDEVPFSPSHPSDDTPLEEPIPLNIFTAEDGEDAALKESIWLGRSVRQTLEKTEGKNSIGILLFTRNRIIHYLKALRNAGVPVQVKEGLLLKERPEVQYLLQVARLLSRPQDDLAWASLLRSPWSWHDIATLRDTALQKSETWREKFREECRKRPELSSLSTALDGAFRRLGRDPLGSVVGRFWEDMGGPSATAHLYGMQGVVNCRRFMEILRDSEAGTPQETLVRLEGIIDKFYEPSDPMASQSPVQMMTIHKAKGLEFDTVYLPFLDWQPLKSGPSLSPPYLLERTPGSEGKFIIAMGSDRRSPAANPLYNLLMKFRKDREWGESKRRFYVASTRARKSIMLSGICNIKDGTVIAPKRSVLEWLMEHDGINRSTKSQITDAVSPHLIFSVNPPSLETSRKETIIGAEAAEPLMVMPERPPYIVNDPPSRTAYAYTGSTEVSDSHECSKEINRIRGIMIHRIIQTWAEGKALPQAEAVSRALIQEGLSRRVAENLADDIIGESERTVNSPFLSRLLTAPTASVRAEWPVEDMPRCGYIRKGIIDLAVRTEDTLWVIDFKTARPTKDKSPSLFFKTELENYRDQLLTYRIMLSKVTSPSKINIRTGIFFTYINEWNEIA